MEHLLWFSLGSLATLLVLGVAIGVSIWWWAPK